MKHEDFCVIDDDLEVLEGLCDLLKPLGGVRGFSSALAALDAFEHGFQPLITVVDLKMPEMNGLDLIKSCRAHGFGGSIVLSSGNASRADLGLALNVGVEAFLEKPYTIEALRTTVAEVTCRSVQRMESRSDLFEELSKVYWERLLLIEDQNQRKPGPFLSSQKDIRFYLELLAKERSIMRAIHKSAGGISRS